MASHLAPTCSSVPDNLHSRMAAFLSPTNSTGRSSGGEGGSAYRLGPDMLHFPETLTEAYEVDNPVLFQEGEGLCTLHEQPEKKCLLIFFRLPENLHSF